MPKLIAAPDEGSVLVSVHQVARMLACSARTVYRLSDSGRLPWPLKVGSLLRWRREDIHRWVADGCPRVEVGRRAMP
jgi:excisionase family DNA binding protein